MVASAVVDEPDRSDEADGCDNAADEEEGFQLKSCYV
jgi:hypothetical protein